MFDFLFQNQNGELTSLLDIISANIAEIEQASLAYEKAVCMIAKAIAQSEIIVTDGRNRVKDSTYFRLNIRPNDNQTGTDFWFLVIHKLLSEGECLVVRMNNGKYYVAESWQADRYVMFGKTYSNVILTDGTDTIALARTIYADDALHFKYSSDKLRAYTTRVLNTYGKTLDAINSMEKLSNSGFFKYKHDGNVSFRRKDENGNDKKFSLDDVLKDLKKKLESSGITIIPEQNGITISYMGVESKVTATEIKTMADMMGETAARSFDIPIGVYNGIITENSDATNEFITFAVNHVAEVINDCLNAKLVGEEDYIKGERVFVWLAHFKHIDVIDAAANLDKLRGIGFTLDEVFEMVGYPALNTDFSTSRALTKNYSTDLAEGGNAAADDSDEPEGSNNIATQKLSKHKERRKRRLERA